MPIVVHTEARGPVLLRYNHANFSQLVVEADAELRRISLCRMRSVIQLSKENLWHGLVYASRLLLSLVDEGAAIPR